MNKTYFVSESAETQRLIQENDALIEENMNLKKQLEKAQLEVGLERQKANKAKAENEKKQLECEMMEREKAIQKVLDEERIPIKLEAEQREAKQITKPPKTIKVII